MIQDLKHAIRMLFQTKAWTIVVLLSLALGIGANTALFSAVNGLLLQTVEATNPRALVKLKWTGDNNMVRSSSDYGFSQPFEGGNVRSTFSVAVFQELRKANQTLTDVFACFPIGAANVVINDEADLASALGTLGPYFQVLGVPAALGRTLTVEDDQPGAEAVAVISHAFWRKRFGSDPKVVGRRVTINNQPFTIVGVTPASYTGIQRLGADAPDVTLSMSLESQMMVGQARFTQPTNWYVQIVGRLKPGMTAEQVRANLEGVFHSTARAGMDAYTDALTPEQRALSTNRREKFAVPRLLVLPAATGVYDFDNQSATTTKILAGVVGVLLLLVCANVATLLLSRASARRKEISVRLSMGASRGRFIGQLLTESLVLSGLGGLLGIAVGYWSRQLLPFGQNVPVDWRVFAFVGGLSMVTGILFGLVPAFRTTSVDGQRNERREPQCRQLTFTAEQRAARAAGFAFTGPAHWRRTLPEDGQQSARREHRLQSEQPADVFAEPGAEPLRHRPFGAAPDAGTRTTAGRAGRPRGRALAGASPLRQPKHVDDEPSGRHEGTYPHDVDLAGVLRHHGYPAAGRPPLWEHRHQDVAEGRDHQRGGGEEDVRRPVLALGRTFGGSPENTKEFEIVGVTRDTKYASLREPAPPTSTSSIRSFRSGP